MHRNQHIANDTSAELPWRRYGNRIFAIRSWVWADFLELSLLRKDRSFSCACKSLFGTRRRAQSNGLERL